MIRRSPLPNPLQDVWNLIRAVLREPGRNMLSDHLFTGVAVQRLRAFVPAGNGAVEALTDDGVFGGVDDGSEARAIVADLLCGAAVEFLVGAAQVRFNFLAVADVTNRAEDEAAVADGNWAQHNFHGEFGAVAAAPEEIKACSHASNLGRLGEAFPVRVVSGTVTFRNQDFDLLPKQLVAGVTEEFFGLRVDLHDGAVTFDRNDGVGNGFQEVAGEEDLGHLLRGKRRLRSISGGWQ